LFQCLSTTNQAGLWQANFKTPLDRNFWWMGLVGIFLGLLVGIASLILGIQGWEMARIWLYLLGSAMMILVGVQLFIAGSIARAG
jgi:hypothetical protein